MEIYGNVFKNIEADLKISKNIGRYSKVLEDIENNKILGPGGTFASKDLNIQFPSIIRMNVCHAKLSSLPF